MESENHSPVEPPNLKEEWVLFLLIGCLSMLYAELFSGASKIWFADPWSLLVTFPLYMVHVLFFFNLALYTHRTSPVHLYLWGILFGMYESWITQVLWVGYGAEGPMIGTFLGIGIGEFLALGFFWHPILSFVLPILVFELLALSKSSKSSELPSSRVLPSHVPFLIKRKSNQRYLVFLYIVGSVFMAVNYRGDLSTAVIALGGTYGLIYILYRKASREHFSVYSLRIGNRGMGIIVFYMVTLYVVMFAGFGYYGGRIPGLLPVVTTIGLYGIFGWVIFSSKPVAESVKIPSLLIEKCMKASDYRRFTYFNVCLVIVSCLVVAVVSQLLLVLFLFFYMILCGLGIYIFYKGIILRNKQTPDYLTGWYAALISEFE
jgi:hypothetical protein